MTGLLDPLSRIALARGASPGPTPYDRVPRSRITAPAWCLAARDADAGPTAG